KPDSICHELIHAFHDDDMITLSSFEEGMTRAAEVEVFNNLPTYLYFDRNHSYGYDVYYEALNKQTIGSQNGIFNTNTADLFLLRYQLSGYAWAKNFLENSNFLLKFNRKLYREAILDSTILSTESKLIDIAAAVQPKVENKKFKSWYSQQGVLNTNPPKGYFLYQRINDFTVDYFYRDSLGYETNMPDESVNWEVYDDNNMVMDSGIGITSSPYGWFFFFPELAEGYIGRIKVDAMTTSPIGLISDSALISVGNGEGCFGIVEKANTGTITITPIGKPLAPVTVNVINGSFSVPSLGSVRGRFHAVFVNEAGDRFSKWFNKDASNYFISIQGQ
ncbi:MAG TPA: hypothetical protein VIE65_04590, partial [Methylobacter sp.]